MPMLQPTFLSIELQQGLPSHGTEAQGLQTPWHSPCLAPTAQYTPGPVRALRLRSAFYVCLRLEHCTSENFQMFQSFYCFCLALLLNSTFLLALHLLQQE